MWLEIIVGLVFFKLFRRFFYDDDVLELEGSDYSVLFSVADRSLSLSPLFFVFFFLSPIFVLGHKSSSIFLRLKKLYGANVYVGLRIPDADTASRQSIDMVLLTKQYSPFSSFQSFSYFGNGYYCNVSFGIL